MERLADKAAEENLSEVLLCNVVAGEKGQPGRAFFSLKDISDNNQALEWDGMVFHQHRLEFDVNRRCVVNWPKIEHGWAKELRRREADSRQVVLPRSDSWDTASMGGEEAVPSKEGGM